MDLSTIGKNIKNYRKQLNISQKQLAVRAGLSKAYICKIENGSKTPSLESFIKIANALRVPAELLLSGVIMVSSNETRNSSLSDKISKLSMSDKEFIYSIVDSLVNKFNDY